MSIQPDPSIVDLAGGPTYVYELEELRAAVGDLRAALPEPSELYYSLKANPYVPVVGELLKLGCRAEVSSAGELRAALEAGCPPGHCLYTGPSKQPAEIAYAVDHGVTWFSTDSPAEMAKVSSAAQEAGVEVNLLLRVNADEPVPGMSLTMTGEPSQFGADASWVLANPLEFTTGPACTLRGFHLYMGTNIFDPDNLLQTFEAAIRLSRLLAQQFDFEPDVVDLGGGFAHPYAQAGERPDYTSIRQRLEALLDEHLPGWRRRTPRIAFESGRYLTGSSGALLCTVQDVKTSKGRTFVLLDSGIHHLGGMAGLRRLPRVTPSLQTPAGTEPDEAARFNGDGDRGENGGGEMLSDVVGPLCTPLDSWARGVKLPKLVPGDVVAIPNVGAYGLTGSLIGFLSHDPPAEIVTERGDLREITRLALSRTHLQTQ